MDTQTLLGFAAIAGGLAVFMLLYAIYSPRRPARQKNTVADEVFGEQGYRGTAEGVGKYIQPILRNFMPNLPSGIMTKNRDTKYAELLRQSGNPWKVTPEELFVLQIAFAIIGLLVGAFVAVFNAIPQIPIWAIPTVLGFVGFFVPYAQHTSLRQKRADNVEKTLPEALDLLTVMIRSGQTFEPALRKVTPQLPQGFLREEFTRINIELQAGRSLQECMISLADNNASDSTESFSKAIIQAQRIGADVTETLTQQSIFARDNHEARLERMIARLGTTMFIPLTVCMLPAMMIIFIAPALSNLSGFIG